MKRGSCPSRRGVPVAKDPTDRQQGFVFLRKDEKDRMLRLGVPAEMIRVFEATIDAYCRAKSEAQMSGMRVGQRRRTSG